MSVRIAAVIPARMASTRFPGKPLLDFQGLPMIEHVRRRTAMCQDFTDVVVATCDKEIAEVVEGYGGNVIMTSASHIMASDRVAEALQSIDCTHVINVQGDEILILPEELQKMIEAIRTTPGAKAWNAVSRIHDAAELTDNSIVKCVVSRNGRIMYCDRQFGDFTKSAGFEPVRIILGILGYERDFLFQYGRLKQSPIEKTKSIDQSRIIENDEVIIPVEFTRGYPGINEPREVELVNQYLKNDARQRAILTQILH